MKEFTQKYYLTAGECNPQLEMPLPLLVQRIIEVSTLHANAWGVGYAHLIEEQQVWVLSRVTVEMKRYPRVNEDYTLITWIEDYNRYFSQRNIEIQDGEGNAIGYARTIWVVMNTASRELMDISKLSYIRENVSERPCPIEPQSRLVAAKEGKVGEYTFRYTDTDLNRHVNSVKYVELMMNQWDLEHYDNYTIKRFEISYMKECLYGMTAKVIVDESVSQNDVKLDVVCDEANGKSTVHTRGRIVFEKRN